MSKVQNCISKGYSLLTKHKQKGTVVRSFVCKRGNQYNGKENISSENRDVEDILDQYVMEAAWENGSCLTSYCERINVVVHDSSGGEEGPNNKMESERVDSKTRILNLNKINYDGMKHEYGNIIKWKTSRTASI